MNSIPFRLILPEASSISIWVDVLLAYLTLTTALTTLGIAVVMLFFLVKYRRRSPDESGRQAPSSVLLELAWTVLPLGVMITFFVAGAIVYSRYERPPSGSMDIYVVAKQWMWTLQHPQGPREINELHVPVGRSVRLIMTSEDVIHSFFVPAFRIKQDVLPNRSTQTWFRSQQPGRYRLNCAQYCGTSHSEMVGWIDVMEPDAFQKWMAGAATGPSMAEAGKKLFQDLGCAQCHSRPCPPMRGLYGSRVALQDGSTVVADSDYIRESILDPQAKIVAGYEPQMPTFQGQVGEMALQQLIVYIQSLSEQGGAASPDTAFPRARSSEENAR